MVHRVFRHKNGPFGLAGMKQQLTGTFGGEMHTVDIKMTLRDHGQDAKPKLGDLIP